MKHTATALALLLIAGSLGACAATTTSEPTDDGPSLAEAHPSLADLAWLEGRWTGTLGGTPMEEVWLAPKGQDMSAIMRWYNADGSLRMHELMSIRVEEAGPVFRLRHFDGATNPWKSEADGPIRMAAAEITADRLVLLNEAPGDLRRLAYIKTADDELKVEFHFGTAEGDPTQTIHLTRSVR